MPTTSIVADALSGVQQEMKQHGILGMKWGHRNRRDDTPAGVTKANQAAPGKRVVAKGGKGLPANEDAIKTAIYKQKARKSSTDSLSTKELKDLVERMNLEQQYSKLSNPQGQQKNGLRKSHDLLKEGLQMQQTYNQIMSIPGVRESLTELRNDIGGEIIKAASKRV